VSDTASDEGLLTEDRFAVLNAVYLRKMASAEHVSQVADIDVPRATELLGSAEGDGLLVDLGGQYMLSDAGRERVLTYYRDAYAETRALEPVKVWYDRFETVNAAFIGLVTEWQKSDADERVQERLVRLVERHVASLRELSKYVPRYEAYAARFESGLTRVDAGERDYVCKPTIDSVHNVWFEFHEDILAVLGRPRET
jgi:hypothetical protein